MEEEVLKVFMSKSSLYRGSRGPGSFQVATSSLETTEAAKKSWVWLVLRVGRRKGQVFTVLRLMACTAGG